MDFSLSKRRRKVELQQDTEYGSHLQLYSTPPQGNITLTEFENYALDRLTVLRAIYNCGVKYKKGSEPYMKNISNEMKQHLPLHPNSTDETEQGRQMKYQERRKDHISHFLLRIAYCKTEDARRWFCDQEKELFRLRLENDSYDIPVFMQNSNLKFEVVSSEEIAEKESLIRESSHIFANKDKIVVYKVPFTEALDLVRSRRVYIENGMAYVPQTELVSIITGLFRTRLSKSLIKTSRALPAISDDERIMSMLNNLTTAYVGEDYSNTKSEGQISISQLSALSKSSFPPCMRSIYEHFTSNHHMKHGGRLQFCLFLKGIGLSMEDVRSYFRGEFCKKMDSESYSKSGHDYMVRHLFGKEGKRADKKPYNCLKIITTSHPSAGDCHGCPFKHYDADNLERQLLAWKIPKIQAKEMVSLSSDNHFQIACTKYFEVVHKMEDIGFGLSHPNQYFLKSQEMLGNKVNTGSQGFNPSQAMSSTPATQSSSTDIDLSGVDLDEDDSILMS